MLAPLLLLLACTPTAEPEPDEEKDFSCPPGTVWQGQECGEPEPEDSEPADDTAPDDSRVDSDPPDPCRVEVLETLPMDGATDVFYRSEVAFTLSRYDRSAGLSIDDVPGQSRIEEDVVTFTPDAPLSPSTEYTARFTYCEGQRELSLRFTTSSTGAAVDSQSLVGQTWQVDLLSGRIVEPPGVGSLLESYLEFDLLLQAVQADANTLGLRMASGDDQGTQEPCAGTVDLVTDFSANPAFSYGPQDTRMPFGANTVTLEDFTLSGALTPDSSGMQGLRIGGRADTRPLVDLVEEGGPDDAICSLMAGFGVTCVTCSSDGGPYCIDLLLVDARAGQSATALQEIPGDCDESCQDADGQCPELGCAATGRGEGTWLALLAALGLALRRRARVRCP